MKGVSLGFDEEASMLMTAESAGRTQAQRIDGIGDVRAQKKWKGRRWRSAYRSVTAEVGEAGSTFRAGEVLLGEVVSELQKTMAASGRECCCP